MNKCLDEAHFGTYSLGDSQTARTPRPNFTRGTGVPRNVSTLPAAALGLPSLGTWRALPPAAPVSCFRLLFNPFCTRGALLLLPLAALLPSGGAGIPVCLFHYLTGLPCPGCGLTRAFSSLLHGEGQAAFAYHPFAFILLPLFVLIAAYNFFPAGTRQGLKRFFDAHDRKLRLGYNGLIYAFVVFGVLRMLASAAWGRLGV